MNEATRLTQHAIVQRCVDTLREHFEHVQILVSKDLENGNTRSIKKGSGNHYARMGMCRECLIEDNENSRIDRREERRDDDDDGEGAWEGWL